MREIEQDDDGERFSPFGFADEPPAPDSVETDDEAPRGRILGLPIEWNLMHGEGD